MSVLLLLHIVPLRLIMKITKCTLRLWLSLAVKAALCVVKHTVEDTLQMLFCLGGHQ